MPHLSPMNWLLALPIFWLFMILLTTKSWWIQLSSMSFSSTKSKQHSSSTNNWKWNWH